MKQLNYTTCIVEIVRCPICQLPHDLDVLIPPIVHEWVDDQESFLRPMRFECPNQDKSFEREIVIDVHYGSLRATDRAAWYGDEEYLSGMSDEMIHLMEVQLGKTEWDPDLVDPSSHVFRR